MLEAAAVRLDTALREATQSHSARPAARLDAEILAMHVCGIARAALITRSSESLDIEQYERLRQLVARRRAGEPVAYLTGTRDFWSLPLSVTPAVLIPRPETELLVECALAHIPCDAEDAIADLGTGSGAIALAVAHERPRCRVIATDISAAALAVARDNARRLTIGNVEFQLGDWLAHMVGRKFHVILSNPPYVRADDPHLREGDLRFEPKTALVGGLDGLDAIRRIAADVRPRLCSGGRLLLEHGYDQADTVAEILTNAGFDEVMCHRDLAHQPRVTEGRG